MQTRLIALALALLGCDSGGGALVGAVGCDPCAALCIETFHDECVNAKTCPDGVCIDDALESCARAKSLRYRVDYCAE